MKTNRQEFDKLQQAYMSIYEASSDEEDTEGEKMDAAIEIQQSAEELDDQGKKLTPDLNRAKNEASKYMNYKIKKLKES